MFAEVFALNTGMRIFPVVVAMLMEFILLRAGIELLSSFRCNRALASRHDNNSIAADAPCFILPLPFLPLTNKHCISKGYRGVFQLYFYCNPLLT